MIRVSAAEIGAAANLLRNLTKQEFADPAYGEIKVGFRIFCEDFTVLYKSK